jgi:large subunit ribosomal protein L21
VYAIIRTGGKQYRVQAGDVVRVEHLEAEVGSTVTLDEVLFVGDEAGMTLGAPLVANAAVQATVVEDGRDKKIRVFKYKKRKHYRRTKGHRQSFTAVRIDKVSA